MFNWKTFGNFFSISYIWNTAGSALFKFLYGEETKIKVFRSLSLVHAMAGFGCLLGPAMAALGGMGYVASYVTVAGATLSISVYKLLKTFTVYPEGLVLWLLQQFISPHWVVENIVQYTNLCMGSVGNSNPWAPFDNFRDCSQGICSRFCLQFCYTIFPPPPFDDSTPFSPLIIAIIGVLASAFILVSYYTIVTRYCRRNDHAARVENQENRDESGQEQWQVASAGLDESLIKTITVCKYQKGDGLIEGTECAVCLGEFQEMESLRLLPKCSHAFHLPCIDTWLESHSSCPLCRAGVVVALPYPTPPPMSSTTQVSSALNASSYEIQPPNDLILVVDNREERVYVSFVSDEDASPKSPIQENLSSEIGSDQESARQIQRSVSFGTFSSQRRYLISDVLKIEGGDEDLQENSNESWRVVGSSKGRSEIGMKRSVSSTDRICVNGSRQRQEFYIP